MSETDGLITAYQMHPDGAARALEWDDLERGPREEAGFCWIHLELEATRARTWLREKSGLAEIEVEALLAEETRPVRVRWAKVSS